MRKDLKRKKNIGKFGLLIFVHIKRASNLGVGGSNPSGRTNLIRYKRNLPRENSQSVESMISAGYGYVRLVSASFEPNRRKIGVRIRPASITKIEGQFPDLNFKHTTFYRTS